MFYFVFKRHPGWRGHDLGSAKVQPWSPHVILVLGVVGREIQSALPHIPVGNQP